MFLVKLTDERYSSLEFRFDSMEEVSIFVETALKASNKLLQIDITVKVKEAE